MLFFLNLVAVVSALGPSSISLCGGVEDAEGGLWEQRQEDAEGRAHAPTRRAGSGRGWERHGQCQLAPVLSHSVSA